VHYYENRSAAARNSFPVWLKAAKRRGTEERLSLAEAVVAADGRLRPLSPEKSLLARTLLTRAKARAYYRLRREWP
jgi:hypothetical protein